MTTRALRGLTMPSDERIIEHSDREMVVGDRFVAQFTSRAGEITVYGYAPVEMVLRAQARSDAVSWMASETLAGRMTIRQFESWEEAQAWARVD